MGPSSAIQPVEKNLLLVGAGNAHLVFVRRFRMKPLPGVAVTLISEAPQIPYSAMVPAHIAGNYTWDEITIDLVRLCASANVRLVPERVTRIEPVMRRVHFENRVPLVYDAVSLGLGSIPKCPADLRQTETSFVMRPLGKLIENLELLEKRLGEAPRPFHFVVVGGGASGCELALAIHKRIGKNTGFRMSLFQAGPRLLPGFPEAAASAFRQALAGRGIAVRVNARVTGGGDGSLILETGERVPFDAVLWATDASPPDLLRSSGLTLDEGGFLRVRDTLQSVSDPAVFGTGDCVSFASYPDLPKNGVYAVRQGPVLYDNVAAFFHEKPLQPFRPQKNTLTLLNTADGAAVFSYGGMAWKGRLARKLKDRIDRAWMEKYTTFPQMVAPANGEAESYTMRCGGCGSKISGDVLSAVLKRIDIPDDPRILLGTRAGEDAAVHRFRPELFGSRPAELVEVQTVDFFKAFIDDPYLFGRIAALNSVSDLYAMNARPFSALAIATLPYARGPVQEAQLFELLSGAVQTLREAGVALTGGHTTEGPELALGFAVTGYGEEDRLFQKKNLRPGDVLVLTKALGSGALLAAWMRGTCRAAWFTALKRSMLLSNGPAGAIFDRGGVTACTDVTGFGLAGHLLEMLDASQVSARLRAANVPVYEGFREVVATGIVSSLQRDNAKVSCRVQTSGVMPEWLFDPQTSGGMLAALKPEAVEETLRQLRGADYRDCAVIGEVIALEPDTAPTLIV